jgi:formate-nitrite transporter family protein
MEEGGRTMLAAPVDPRRDRLRGGEPPAAVTLLMYGDYECPYSRAAYRSVQAIERQLGERLRFVFRHFPLREIHPHAQLAAETAEEAAAQDRFWAMHDLLFERQKALELPSLRGYAGEVGMDLGELEAAVDEGRHRARIEEDVSSGLRSGVEGTPTLFIDGALHRGSYMPDELELALTR